MLNNHVEISKRIRKNALKMRSLYPERNAIDRWISELPETVCLFRGSSLDEYNNIVAHKTQPGIWWSLHVRKALIYASQGIYEGTRGILILRDFPKCMIETMIPLINEVTICCDFNFIETSIDFVPLLSIIDYIKETWSIEESPVPFQTIKRYEQTTIKQGISGKVGKNPET